ncbi:MAG TPA: cell surface protein [Flavobacterium sp.]|nr:cell surface protein [Flavobacterium sp.]HAT80256.1 cell surface protein [Flavobacterium sp.]
MKKITLFICLALAQLSFGQTVNWAFPVPSAVRIETQSPAIAADGTIYIGSENNTAFHAINPDGTLKWTYTDITDNVYSPAAIGSDGTIYVGAKDKFLHAIKPDGTQKWKFNTVDFSIGTSPAIANNGTIYIGVDKSTGSNMGKFYAINPDGTQKWVFTTATFSIRSTAAIASDGTVYVASDDNFLYALNPDTGSVKWSFDLGGDVDGHIALDSDGTIFVGVDEGTPNGSVIAITPSVSSATLKWKSVNTGRVLSSPVLNNGVVYFGTKDTNKLFALNAATGAEIWSYTVGDIINCTPAIGDDGKIYFGSYDDKLYCLNADGTLNFSVTLSAFNLWSSPAIRNGNLYIGSYDGKLYSVAIPSTGLASSNWPMFGKNLLHTSSADATLGIDDFNANYGKQLSVFYKNGDLNLKVEGYNGKAKLALFDLLGRNLKSLSIELQENNFEKIALNSIQPGTYILNVQTENNATIGSKKFIINN